MSSDPREGRIDFIEFPAGSIAALTRTKRFYAEAFRWTFQEWGDDYVDTKNSGVGSGINADADHNSAMPLAVVYCEDIDAAKTRIIAAGGRLLKDVYAFPGGRRFHFADPAGNELAVWSDK